jgi:hypothetical protein
VSEQAEAPGLRRALIGLPPDLASPGAPGVERSIPFVQAVEPQRSQRRHAPPSANLMASARAAE